MGHAGQLRVVRHDEITAGAPPMGGGGIRTRERGKRVRTNAVMWLSQLGHFGQIYQSSAILAIFDHFKHFFVQNFGVFFWPFRAFSITFMENAPQK